ncbi:CHAT domain-containing protein [Trichormus azollae]|uniref:CHAT domain-containing protein n=1 Tax=Trichormus azollae TaxID=1164 RepID=UPI00325D2FB4
MSLWNVDDKATSELIPEFVKNLYTYIPAKALRKAVVQLKKQYPKQPYKWACFVFFGISR